MKNTAIPLTGVSLLLLVGCTNSFDKVRDAVNQAPDWYESSRKEIRGEGYPELAEVPVLAEGDLPGKTLKASGDRAGGLRQVFESERAAFAADSPAVMAEMLARVSQEFAALPPEAGFLTEAEIQALRADFNVPRVTEGIKVRRK